MTAPVERDVVIPLGPVKGKHPELRWALRSIATNLPHRKVWIAGATPPVWCVNVVHIPVPQVKSKYENSTVNLLTACRHPEMSDEFTFSNDDMYILTPQPDGMPVYHRGPLVTVERYYRAKGHYAYGVGITQTRQLLERWGHKRDALMSYDVHCPIPLHKDRTVEIIERARADRYIMALHKRSLVGNECRLGGTRLRDPKVVGWGAFDTTAAFLSSTKPQQFNGRLGRFLKARFPDKCVYEEEV